MHRRNLMTTLEAGRIRTCLRPRFSALEIVLRQSASTDMRTIFCELCIFFCVLSGIGKTRMRHWKKLQTYNAKNYKSHGNNTTPFDYIVFLEHRRWHTGCSSPWKICVCCSATVVVSTRLLTSCVISISPLYLSFTKPTRKSGKLVRFERPAITALLGLCCPEKSFGSNIVLVVHTWLSKTDENCEQGNGAACISRQLLSLSFLVYSINNNTGKLALGNSFTIHRFFRVLWLTLVFPAFSDCLFTKQNHDQLQTSTPSCWRSHPRLPTRSSQPKQQRQFDQDQRCW